MAESGQALAERLALCDLFGDVGADAPTLCGGWTTADLAAHLVTRERRLDAGPGLVAGGPLRRHTERVTEGVRRRHGYGELVRRIRSGPPLGLRRLPSLDDRVNLHEYFVHHEDVRRANGHGPRSDAPELQDALWRLLRRWGPLLLRRVRTVGVELARPDGEMRTARTGERVARITGEPGELLLYVFGRRGAAKVELSGDDEAVAAVQTADLAV